MISLKSLGAKKTHDTNTTMLFTTRFSAKEIEIWHKQHTACGLCTISISLQQIPVQIEPQQKIDHILLSACQTMINFFLRHYFASFFNPALIQVRRI
jgi:hypothetical protein